MYASPTLGPISNSLPPSVSRSRSLSLSGLSSKARHGNSLTLTRLELLRGQTLLAHKISNMLLADLAARSFARHPRGNATYDCASCDAKWWGEAAVPPSWRLSSSSSLPGARTLRVYPEIAGREPLKDFVCCSREYPDDAQSDDPMHDEFEDANRTGLF